MNCLIILSSFVSNAQSLSLYALMISMRIILKSWSFITIFVDELRNWSIIIVVAIQCWSIKWQIFWKIWTIVFIYSSFVISSSFQFNTMTSFFVLKSSLALNTLIFIQQFSIIVLLRLFFHDSIDQCITCSTLMFFNKSFFWL